ncbi:hypothetical protein LguiB_020353 [Lonicera macranthoides]
MNGKFQANFDSEKNHGQPQKNKVLYSFGNLADEEIVCELFHKVTKSMVLTRSGWKRLEMSKTIGLNQEGESVSVTDTTCSSKRSRLLPTENAPVRWNSTKNFAACVKDVQELGFDGHQMSLVIAKFIKSDGWLIFFHEISREAG